MKKLKLTLTLSGEDAERLNDLWDQVNLSQLMEEALKDFIYERTPADRYVFKRFGAIRDEFSKEEIVRVGDYCRAAKLLLKANIEDEEWEEND